MLTAILAVLGCVAAAGFAVLVAAFLALRKTAVPPAGCADGVRGSPPPGVRRVVCAGDSLTHGGMSFDYVQALRERLGPAVEVLNAGVGGDLAFNLAERLPSIVACEPSDVVVLIGTNDLCGAQTSSMGRRLIGLKKLPEVPSQDFFERQLTRILEGLRTQTRARVVVVTPPLLGEDLSHPAHARLCTYARSIAAIADAHGATVVPLHESMATALVASGHVPRPGFHPGRVEVTWMLMVPFQRHVLKMSYDRIAHGHGLWGSPDLVHLNETSGAILVDRVEACLRASTDAT